MQRYSVFLHSEPRTARVNSMDLEFAVDWDNLRYFLELSRAGKLTIAARRLAVDHTTVARRVQALEKSLDRQLFIRAKAGYRLSEANCWPKPRRWKAPSPPSSSRA